MAGPGIVRGVLFVPLRSEEDLGHPPRATLAVIAAYALVALLLGFAPAALLLDYDRFRPHTWVTSAFVHGDVAHLFGNTIFLLAFGMVVEGLLGWRRFLAFYLGLALVQGAIEQMLFHGSGGGSYGASGCVFGLMAAAALWAPERRIRCVYWFWRWVDVRPLPVWGLASWWIGWELLYAIFSGFRFGSAFLHLLGAALGLGGAMLLLRRRWVDCDGHDWLSLRRSEHRPWKEFRPDPAALPPATPPTPYELLRSLVNFWLPVLGGGLVALGLLLVHGADWQDPDPALARTAGGFVFLALGAAVFVWWRRR